MDAKNQDLYNTLVRDTERSPVELGAELLDHVAPGWWQDGKVDLNILDLGHYYHCILGQLFGGYDEGRDRLAEYLGQWNRFCSLHFGFSVDGPADYDDLTEDWRNLINDRRAIAEEYRHE